MIDPLPPLARYHRYCRTQRHEPISTHHPTHAGPGGRRTSPACGSCRRPLKSNEKQGSAKHCAKAQNASFPSICSRGMENQFRSNAFRAPSTSAPTRRTLKSAYLSLVWGGALPPAVTATAKKRPPSGTQERLCLLEEVAPSKTTIVFALSHLRFRKPSTQIDNSGPFLRQPLSDSLGGLSLRHGRQPKPPTKHQTAPRGRGAPTPPDASF